MTEYGETKADALSALREVVELADSAGARTLARALRDDRIPRLEDERFHLVVLGEFNHGKTTFVNALLGKPVLPTGVTPTTAVIHRIEHGDVPTATATVGDGSSKPVPIDELGQYEVDGKALAESVQHLTVHYPAPMLAEGVVLVDTPGVNDLNDARAEITYGYIPRSDAILFLLDAGQILKESERAFIAGKLLTASRDKVYFVVNKMDLLSDEEREEALAYARMNLAKLVEDPKVYGISAEQALEGDRATSGIETLVGELQRFLQDERGRVLLDNALDAGIRTAATLKTGIEIQKRALGMEQDDLDKRLRSLEADLENSGERLAQRERRIREALAGVKAVVRADIDAFAERFGRELPDQIEQSDAKDLRRYLGGFIEEKLREMAESEAEEVTRRLEKVAEEAIAFVTEDATAQAEKLRDAFGTSAPKLELEVSTFAYDVGVFAVGAFGITLMVLSNVIVGGAMALAAPVLAYVFRGRADKQLKSRAKEEAPKVVQDACSRMADGFDAKIDEFGEKLVAFVASANEELSRSIAELVRTARDARQSGSDALEELESGSGMGLVRLADVQQRMETMRRSLWSNGKGTEAEAH